MVRKIFMALGAGFLVSSAADAEWQVATSKHFIVYSNDAPARVKAFTERLETFDKAMRVWHVSPEDKRGASARVTVFVVSNVDEVQKIGGMRNVAGFYEARAGDSVAFTPRNSGSGADYGMTSQAVLFHEYTHHWMLTNDQWSDAAFPPWFTEGFAEMHATAMFRDGNVIFGAQPTYRRFTVGNINLLPTERLLKPDPGRLSDEERDALYSRGWLLTDYLFFDPGRRTQLAAYITAINSGTSVQEANALLGSPSTLDFKMNAWGKGSVKSAIITKEQLTIGAVNVRELTVPEAAVMPALLVSKRGVSAKTAPAVAALARRLAAPYPNDPVAQNELAEAEYDVCATDPKSDAPCYDRSEAASNRALAADPTSVHALVYKGMAEVAAAKKAKVTDPATWSTIRRIFLAANKIDHDAPQPLIQFYESFAAAGQPPTKNAEGGLLYAYALAPYDSDVRLDAARVLLGQDHAAQAKAAIGPVAYNVDSPVQAARAQKVLAALSAGGSKAALVELDKRPEEKEKNT